MMKFNKSKIEDATNTNGKGEGKRTKGTNESKSKEDWIEEEEKRKKKGQKVGKESPKAKERKGREQGTLHVKGGPITYVYYILLQS